MANLKSIREKIQSIADYKATNQGHLDDIDLLINDAYEYTWLCRSWSFAQKLIYFNTYPDLDATITAKNASVTDFSRKVVFSGSIKSLLDYTYAGNIFECQGREYVILKVVSDNEIRLVEPFRGTTFVDDISWKLKVRYYELPEDLVQVCSISHRDVPIVGGRRQYLNAVLGKREEELQLAEDRTATYADFYIHIPPTNIPSGEKLLELPASAQGATGTLVAGTYYEFAWCFRANGNLYGPLSEPLTVQSKILQIGVDKPVINLRTITHDNQIVVSPAYNNTYDRYPNVWEGLKKVLWTNVNIDHTTGKRLGLPKWVSVTSNGALQNQYDNNPKVLDDEQSDWSIAFVEQLSAGNKKYIEIDGHHHVIRPYPRINSYDVKYPWASYNDGAITAPEEYFKQLEMRYLYKPQDLCQITDSPEMPYELHDLIVYKALEDYFTKKGNANLAQMYRNRFELDLVAAEKKYVERLDVNHQRSLLFGGSRGRSIFASTDIKRSSW